eukprot:1613263-Pleurochrysis_carterae.AAC.2
MSDSSSGILSNGSAAKRRRRLLSQLPIMYQTQYSIQTIPAIRSLSVRKPACPCARGKYASVHACDARQRAAAFGRAAANDPAAELRAVARCTLVCVGVMHSARLHLAIWAAYNLVRHVCMQNLAR